MAEAPAVYLRWIARHEKRPGENEPFGLVLCAEADEAQVELLELNRGDIRVAKYLPALPSPEVFRARLREALRRERERLEAEAPKPARTAAITTLSPAAPVPASAPTRRRRSSGR